MRHALALEGAEDKSEGVGPAEVLQDGGVLGRQFRPSRGEPRQVEKLQVDRRLLRRAVQAGQPLEPLVRHGNAGTIRMVRASGVRGGVHRPLREGVEETRLARRGQANEGDVHGWSSPQGGET